MSQKMLAHVKARPINHILYLLLFLKVSWNSWQTNFWEKITRIKQQKVILSKLTERLLLLVHRRIPTQTFRGLANCALDQPYVSTELDPHWTMREFPFLNMILLQVHPSWCLVLPFSTVFSACDQVQWRGHFADFVLYCNCIEIFIHHCLTRFQCAHCTFSLSTHHIPIAVLSVPSRGP